MSGRTQNIGDSVKVLMATAIPARFRGRARRDAAAFYLSQLSRGILAGELMIVSGDRPTALVTGEFLLLEIDVRQGKRVNNVEVRVRWRASEPAKRQLEGSRGPAPPSPEH